MIKAVRTIYGKTEHNTFTQKAWDNLHAVLWKAQLHPKDGWQRIPDHELDSEAKEIVKKTRQPRKK